MRENSLWPSCQIMKWQFCCFPQPPSKKELRSISFIPSLWKSLCKIGIILSINVSMNSFVKCSGPGSFLWEGFIITHLNLDFLCLPFTTSVVYDFKNWIYCWFHWHEGIHSCRLTVVVVVVICWNIWKICSSVPHLLSFWILVACIFFFSPWLVL